MQQTTLMLPPELKNRAMSRARRAQISFGRFVRSAIEEKLKRPAGRSPESDRDPFFACDAVIEADLPSDLARNHDKYLADE